jgi:hypothetical protein
VPSTIVFITCGLGSLYHYDPNHDLFQKACYECPKVANKIFRAGLLVGIEYLNRSLYIN